MVPKHPFYSRSLFACVSLFVVLFFTGCETTGSKWNPLNWIFGRKGAKVEQMGAKVNDGKRELVQAAQAEVLKTGVAIDAAISEHPESQPLSVAKRTNDNAANLLNQNEPLSAAIIRDAMETVTGLLSKESDKRAAAEAKQAQVEKKNDALSVRVAELEAALKKAEEAARSEAANNLNTANQLRAATLWKWTTTGASLVLGAAALAYRFNVGNLQSGIGEGLAKLQRKYGADDEDIREVKHAIDARVGGLTQNAIATALRRTFN